MKIAEMKEIAVSYENVACFLSQDAVAKVRELTGLKNVAETAEFKIWAWATIAQYIEKKITNKAASEAIEILKNASRPKTERFRRDGSKVYEYSVSHNCYGFIGNYNTKEFKALVEENGRFI